MVDPKVIAAFITEDPDVFVESGDDEVLQKLRYMLRPMTGPGSEANLAIADDFPGGEKKLRSILAVYADTLMEKGIDEGIFIRKALEDNATEQEILNIAKNSTDPIAQKIALSITTDFEPTTEAFIKNPRADPQELANLVEDPYSLHMVSVALGNPNMPAESLGRWWAWAKRHITDGAIVSRHAGVDTIDIQAILMAISKSGSASQDILTDMWDTISGAGNFEYEDFIDVLYYLHENTSTPERIKSAINPDGFDLKTEMGEWLNGYGARGR